MDVVLTKFARSRAKSALLPRAHGSALFSRGETQAVTLVTLGHHRGRAGI